MIRPVDALDMDIERGQCVYVVAYESGRPAAVCFAGYRYD
jgi:hypothetical protein